MRERGGGRPRPGGGRTSILYIYIYIYIYIYSKCIVHLLLYANNNGMMMNNAVAVREASARPATPARL